MGYRQALYSRVPDCQITTYYYVGFAYLMMRRYADAIRTFSNILLYIQRTKQQLQGRGYQSDHVSLRPLLGRKVVWVLGKVSGSCCQCLSL